MIEERRKHQRAKRQIPLKIADKGFDVITETADISSSGINCRITRLLPLMSKIVVVLLVPTKQNGSHTRKIRCKGVVVRSDPVILQDVEKAHYNVAIFFTDISKKDQKIIDAYMGPGGEIEEEIHIT
ncbi:MAG: PilZ domain-containing protein [Candidatus Gorgyraea atricola]|nr:PilZ domain-containing protein [Candidatus Gorgyraea atricola]